MFSIYFHLDMSQWVMKGNGDWTQVTVVWCNGEDLRFWSRDLSTPSWSPGLISFLLTISLTIFSAMPVRVLSSQLKIITPWQRNTLENIQRWLWKGEWCACGLRGGSDKMRGKRKRWECQNLLQFKCFFLALQRGETYCQRKCREVGKLVLYFLVSVSQ